MARKDPLRPKAKDFTSKDRAATIAGIFTDKSLLLSGQPTSRIARMDERFMAPDEMRVKLEAELKRFAKMQQEAEDIGFVPVNGTGSREITQ